MSTEKNIILIPTDFGEQSLTAVDQSYNIAKMTNAEICLLNVIIEGGPIWGLFSPKEQDDVYEKLKNKLDNLAKDVEKKSGVKVNCLIEKGKLVDVILEVADRLDAKFILVGTSSSKDIKQKIIGSNALRLIREAKCPVITIKGKHHRQGCKSIILPVDLTKETREKVSHAIHFAKWFGSKVHVVTLMTSTDKYITGRLRIQLEQVQGYIEKQGVECSSEMIKSGTNRDEMAISLLSFAHSVEADLLIIMTQQEIEVIKYFVGSLAQQIIHRSDIPVMSIVPKGSK